ncbi:MAG: hypothetical protein ACRDWD_08125 [Acidimicrobiia bacterium]
MQVATNYQPDVCADDIYYSTAGATVGMAPGSSEHFDFIVQNDGTKKDTLVLKGGFFAADEPGARAAIELDNLELRWFRGTKDVTEKMAAGKLKLRNVGSQEVKPTSDPPLRAEVTASTDATDEDDAVVVLLAHSKHKPTRQDLFSANFRVFEA